MESLSNLKIAVQDTGAQILVGGNGDIKEGAKEPITIYVNTSQDNRSLFNSRILYVISGDKPDGNIQRRDMSYFGSQSSAGTLVFIPYQR